MYCGKGRDDDREWQTRSKERIAALQGFGGRASMSEGTRAGEVMGQKGNTRARRGARALAATLVTLAAFAGLTVFGGLGGLAAVDSSSAAEYEYGEKTTICHKTDSRKKPFVTLSVRGDAVAEHLAHGDTLGPCP